MKKFIRKILLFSTIPLIVGIVALFLFINHINNLSTDYKIDTNITSVYAGDSHIELAINDSLIPKSLNFAANSESFYFSYYKLKMLLENNPSVKKVYLGLSYHNLSNYTDRFISGDFSSMIAPKYFYLLPPKEQIRMLSWNKKNLIPFTKSIITLGKDKMENNNSYPYLGGFYNQFENTQAVDSSMNKRVLFQFYKDDKLNPFSELNLSYLNKIIGLCQSKEVALTVLNTPLHPHYSSKIPKKYKEKLNDFISKNQLKYIDLSNFKLKEQYYIPDGDHVSNSGAQIISTKLKEIVLTP